MITKDRFIDRVKCPPIQDELKRCNCTKAGEPGHEQCGWCPEHDLPQFVCGCFVKNKAKKSLDESEKIG